MIVKKRPDGAHANAIFIIEMRNGKIIVPIDLMISLFTRIVVSDLQGKLEQLFDQISAITAKRGPFDALFLIGKLLQTGKELDPYISGEKKVPILTYLMTLEEEEKYLPPHLFSKIEATSITENMILLGRTGSIHTLGLQVAFSNAIESSLYNPFHNPLSLASTPNMSNSIRSPNSQAHQKGWLHLDKIMKQPHFRGFDLLLTHHWSFGILKNLPSINIQGISMLNMDEFGSHWVRNLAELLAPRYHFASSPTHVSFELPPYSNHPHSTQSQTKSKQLETALSEKEEDTKITRFIGLAEAWNSRKQKFMYAFSILPIDFVSSPLPPSNLLPCPFEYQLHSNELGSSLSDEDSFSNPISRRRQSVDSYSNGRKKKCPPKSLDSKPHPLMTRMEGCWFCLSNPQVEQHLIASVGEEYYLALPKGGMNHDHILIIPINHISSVLSPIAPLDELVKYKKSLSNCFSLEQKWMLYWEKSMPSHTAHFSNKFHAHMQAIAIDKMGIEEAMAIGCQEMQKVGIQWQKLTANGDQDIEVEASSIWSNQDQENWSYFFIQFGSMAMMAIFPNDKKVPLQLGRRIAAKIMQVPHREDWKSCVVGQEEEMKIRDTFGDKFQAFDLS